MTNKFDHRGPVTFITFHGKKFLEQNGKPFTYSEYDRFKKKWIPEPEPLDLRKVRIEVFKKRLGRILPVFSALNEELESMIELLKFIPTKEDKRNGKKA